MSVARFVVFIYFEFRFSTGVMLCHRDSGNTGNFLYRVHRRYVWVAWICDSYWCGMDLYVPV